MSDEQSAPKPLAQRVKKSRAKAKKEGAERLDMWLTPDAAAALHAEVDRTRESKTAVINRLLVSIER